MRRERENSMHFVCVSVCMHVYVCLCMCVWARISFLNVVSSGINHSVQLGQFPLNFRLSEEHSRADC